MAARKAKGSQDNKLVDLDELYPTQAEIDFEEFLEEVGPGTSTVDIFRMNRDSSRSHEERVEFTAIRSDVYAYLRSSFGPGKYLLVFKDELKRFKGSKVVVIGGGPGTNPMQQPANSGTPPQAVSGEQFLREQLAQQQTMILAMIATMKPPDITPMANLMIAAMQSQKPTTDATTMLTSVVGAFTALKGPAKDEDWLDRASKIITLAKGISGADSEDNIYSVVKDVSKEVLGRWQSGAQANGGNGVHAAPALAAAKTTVNAQEPQLNQSNFADWVRAGLVYLKAKAKKNLEIDQCIDWIMENTDEPQWTAILGAIKQGATFEQLLQFDPEIGQNPQISQWFRGLYDGLQQELQQAAAGQQSNEPVDTAGAGGNANHPATHEAPSPTVDATGGHTNPR